MHFSKGYVIGLCLTSVYALQSCKKKSTCREHPDVSTLNSTVTIERLDQRLFQCKDKKSIRLFLQEQPAFARDIIEMDRYPSHEEAIDQLYKLTHDSYLDTLYQDTQHAFGDLAELQKELQQACRFMRYYYPSFKQPTFKSIMTGFAIDLYNQDSIVYIGLDYFVGPKAHYRPQGKPQYILRRYQREYIVPTYVISLASSVNAYDPLDHTLLASMIYWGKTYYFAEHLLPCTPDSLIIGYTEDELQRAQASELAIWQHFLEKKLLFQSNPMVVSKYSDERPYTNEIGTKCPGRIAQWMGWQIVRQYAKKKKCTLSDLMHTSNAQQIFEESGYRPTNK